jgi:2'-5' RNA ligase
MVSNTKKRIFIAINFNELVKEKLVQIQNKIDYSFLDNNPIKWTKKNNLHVTVFFVGYVYDTDLIEIFNQVENAVKDCKPFMLKFNEIDFMPRQEHKKMIWIFGEKNDMLECIRQKIKKNIIRTEKKRSLHSTHSMEINQFQFRKINKEEILISMPKF